MPRKSKTIKYYEAIGRRKEAVARVRLYLVGSDKTVSISNPKGEGTIKIKQGELFVNRKPIREIYSSKADESRFLTPLRTTDNADRFAISILVHGGGKTGQLDAIIHGLARAINKVNSDQYRPSLKKLGLLTRDARTRERRKVGTGGKARRKKQSPKR